ncbi:Fructose-1,6-bisphosphatase/inositol-1-monophosphatase [uncultured archaeon]|nr:Fructose-1,6-bisphosphatase/inositol-1-monophosphatase [uncultured archaeon]
MPNRPCGHFINPFSSPQSGRPLAVSGVFLFLASDESTMSSMQRFMESCVRSAAAIIARKRKEGLSITRKSRNDWATSADYASEKYVVGRIRKEYPDSLVLSEEKYAQSDLSADSLFVLDPIDGTHNFVRGIPLYGISLAHYSGGRPTAGCIYLPILGQMFYAEKGRPATLGGRRISVSRTGKLEEFFLFSDSRLHMVEEKGYLGAVIDIERISQHTRFVGSAVYELTSVACGVVDANLEFKSKPYDFAAGSFIVENAGGKVTDFEGKPWNLSTTAFLASNGRQHKRILDLLNGR